jgi:hypothetical protein
VARRTFFSFHFERDNWRAGQVRNCYVTQDSAGYIDAADWQEVKRKGQAAIEKWIDDQLKGTSVTVVLIGAETSTRDYVGYEIKQSHAKGNGLLGIYIHKIRNVNGETDVKGANPFDNWTVDLNGKKTTLSSIYPTYDWVTDDGRANMGSWIETAYKKANPGS